MRAILIMVAVFMLSACSFSKPLSVKNDVPGLKTTVIDDTLKYVFYKGMVQGEFKDYFRYSHFNTYAN
jgi:hypothetical protein